MRPQGGAILVYPAQWAIVKNTVAISLWGLSYMIISLQMTYCFNPRLSTAKCRTYLLPNLCQTFNPKFQNRSRFHDQESSTKL
ncbi:hypothetical protein UPYG_G00106370 [Umbra pygmaea]|uniref:Uncharacterized protein n=1 Tax=Umbra pygmaea TaxID=75934 RepID=A0ABD0XM95_UMBPY